MGRVSQQDLKPRNGHTLMVGIGCRISGCANQDEQSLPDQEGSAKEHLVTLYDGPVEFVVIATTGKGEALDRPELVKIESLYRQRTLDLFIWEDLGRLVRGAEAVRLMGIGVDHGTRTIVPNDCIDTADANWEEDALTASAAHVANNAHTSKRLKKKLMNRFRTLGGVLPCEIYGYFKPPGAKTYFDLQKVAEATPIYQEMFRRLRETKNQEKVADWLQEQKVPVGKYSRTGRWTGKAVARARRNPLLKGQPCRGTRHTEKRFEDGRCKSVRNPTGPTYSRHSFPHLIHVDPVEFDSVNALLDAKNKGMGRKPVNGIDPLAGLSRHKTRCPSQHATCWYCGRKYVWGGNGITEHLMCPGSRDHACWNSIGVDGPLTVKRLVEAFTADLYVIDGVEEQFRAMVESARRDVGGGVAERRQRLQRDQHALAREQENLAASMAEYGPSPFIRQKLDVLTAREGELANERKALESLSAQQLQLPASTAALRAQLEAQLQKLATTSYEFADLMKKLVPEFHVYLVRLCDGGHLFPRARVRFAFDGLVDDAKHVSGLGQIMTRVHTLDLFERPPQREFIREAAMRLSAEGLEQREIGRHPDLPEPATQTAVSKALMLGKQMQASGMTTPYVLVTEPPADYTKLRRHLNPRYQFSPVEAYTPPSL